jgi:hypothetical protein
MSPLVEEVGHSEKCGVVVGMMLGDAACDWLGSKTYSRKVHPLPTKSMSGPTKTPPLSLAVSSQRRDPSIDFFVK